MDLSWCLWVTLSFAETKIYLPRLPDLRLVQNTNIRSAEIRRMAQQSAIGQARGGGSRREQSTPLRECSVPNDSNDSMVSRPCIWFQDHAHRALREEWACIISKEDTCRIQNKWRSMRFATPCLGASSVGSRGDFNPLMIVLRWPCLLANGLVWISRVAVNILLSFRFSMVEMLNAGVNEFSRERLRTDTLQ